MQGAVQRLVWQVQLENAESVTQPSFPGVPSSHVIPMKSRNEAMNTITVTARGHVSVFLDVSA